MVEVDLSGFCRAIRPRRPILRPQQRVAAELGRIGLGRCACAESLAPANTLRLRRSSGTHSTAHQGRAARCCCARWRSALISVGLPIPLASMLLTVLASLPTFIAVHVHCCSSSSLTGPHIRLRNHVVLLFTYYYSLHFHVSMLMGVTYMHP